MPVVWLEFTRGQRSGYVLTRGRNSSLTFCIQGTQVRVSGQTCLRGVERSPAHHRARPVPLLPFQQQELVVLHGLVPLGVATLRRAVVRDARRGAQASPADYKDAFVPARTGPLAQLPHAVLHLPLPARRLEGEPGDQDVYISLSRRSPRRRARRRRCDAKRAPEKWVKTGAADRHESRRACAAGAHRR